MLPHEKSCGVAPLGQIRCNLVKLEELSTETGHALKQNSSTIFFSGVVTSICSPSYTNLSPDGTVQPVRKRAL